MNIQPTPPASATHDLSTSDSSLGTKQERSIWFLPAALFLTAVHLLFILAFFEPAISTPDASGYFKQARLMATEGRTWFRADSDLQYIPPHWLADEKGRYFSKYPPGLPLLAAALFRLDGPTAALLINPVLASLTLLGLMVFCRRWMGPGWALLVGVCMAVNPVTNQQALWAFAHTAVAFFLIWGMVFVLRGQITRRTGWLFLAGLLLGVIPTIRYGEILLAIGFALFVLAGSAHERSRVRALVALAAGATLPLVALAVRNQLAYGAFWRTGYASTGEQTGFGLSYFAQHALPYLNQLLAEGVGPLFGLAVVGLALLCADRQIRNMGVLLLALIIPTTALYMSYYFPPDGASMRFLVPTLFLYPIAAVWTLRRLAQAFPRPAFVATAATIVVTFVWGFPASIQAMMPHRVTNQALVRAGEAVSRDVPDGSILVVDRMSAQYLDFLGRWRVTESSVLEGDRRQGPPPRRMQAGPGPHPDSPRAPALRRYEDLDAAARGKQFADDVWNWAKGDRRVFVLLNSSAFDELRASLPDGNELRRLESIEPPKLPPGFTQRPGLPGPHGPPGGGRPGRFRGGPGPGGGPGGMPGPMPGIDAAQDEPRILAEWTRAD